MLYTRDATITTTALTTILTVPSGYIAYWSLLFIANHGGSTNSATVYWDKASGTDLYIIDDKNITSKDYIQFTDALLVMQPGDSIKAQIGSIGNFGIACTIDLLEAPAVLNAFNGGA
jgi:hypothetical protein